MDLYVNLLRPISETRAALVSFILCLVTYYLRHVVLFLPDLGLALAAFFLCSSIYYAKIAYNLYLYQRSLSTSARYVIDTSKLHANDSLYFLGMGFEWTAEHTKRIKDLYNRRNKKFLYASNFEKKFKTFLLVYKKNYLIFRLYLFFSSTSILNPFPPRNQTGNAAIHAIGTWEGEDKVYMNIDATNHILIIGGTGSGKSCCLQVLCGQDIDSGRPTIGIDPKGGFKIFAAMYEAAVRNDKVDQFKMVHLAFPEYSAQYNALGTYHRITEVSGRIAEGIDSEENFKQFAWLKSNYIAVALHYIGVQASFDKIKYYVSRCDDLVIEYSFAYIERNANDASEAREFLNKAIKTADESYNNTGHSTKSIKVGKAVNKLIEIGRLPPSDELNMILSYLKENVMHERKLITNIEPILAKLTTGSISQIMVPDYDNPESTKSILDWGQLMNDGEILYIGTNALGDTTTSSTFIQILLEDLSNYLGTLYQYGQDYGRLTPAKDEKKFIQKNVALHIDELSAVKTKAVKNMLARAGELGVKLRIYTQSNADIVQSLGGREEAAATIDNIGAIIMFRVNSQDTADILVSRLNQVGIEKEGRVYGYSDSSSPETSEDFSSSNMQREELESVPLVNHETLMSLPTGQAFILTNGTKLEKLRMPLVEIDENIAPTSIRSMIGVMKSNDTVIARSNQYNDGWFKSAYPEYSSNEVARVNAGNNERTIKKGTDDNFQTSIMTGALESEIGADAAEFSVYGDVDG